MFVDSAVITVRAGHGGAGAVSFRRQKYEPKGGPKGGDGGRGGDVVFIADSGVNTLLDFRGRPIWEAEPGGFGMKKQMHGGDGRACVIKLPAGTLVHDSESGDLIVDLRPGQTFIVARGGNGGFGNEHYKSADNQTPSYAHPGFEGQERTVRLELKLLADVGLLGMPNAGKSTLLAALTKATPKIGDYPFTTLAPQLGVAELDATRRLVIADIPGLIEGASDGAGLGLDFLKHVERTRVLLHVLDAAPPDGTPAEHYRVIRNELMAYSPVLAERDEIIVLNKLDLLENESARENAVKELRRELKLGREVEVVGLSAATRQGTRGLLEKLWTMLNSAETTWKDERDATPSGRGGGRETEGRRAIARREEAARGAALEQAAEAAARAEADSRMGLSGKRGKSATGGEGNALALRAKKGENGTMKKIITKKRVGVLAAGVAAAAALAVGVGVARRVRSAVKARSAAKLVGSAASGAKSAGSTNGAVKKVAKKVAKKIAKKASGGAKKGGAKKKAGAKKASSSGRMKVTMSTGPASRAS